jgi:hypothetical protein
MTSRTRFQILLLMIVIKCTKLYDQWAYLLVSILVARFFNKVMLHIVQSWPLTSTTEKQKCYSSYDGDQVYKVAWSRILRFSIYLAYKVFLKKVILQPWPWPCKNIILILMRLMKFIKLYIFGASWFMFILPISFFFLLSNATILNFDLWPWKNKVLTLIVVVKYIKLYNPVANSSFSILYAYIVFQLSTTFTIDLWVLPLMKVI